MNHGHVLLWKALSTLDNLNEAVSNRNTSLHTSLENWCPLSIILLILADQISPINWELFSSKKKLRGNLSDVIHNYWFQHTKYSQSSCLWLSLLLLMSMNVYAVAIRLDVHGCTLTLFQVPMEHTNRFPTEWWLQKTCCAWQISAMSLPSTLSPVMYSIQTLT